MNVDNKLIAEFLGYSQPHPDYPDTTYWYKKEQPPLTILSFDTDWNWLMEVVEKILQSGDDTDQWDNVLNELQTINIENVYNACIEFIKWHNEQSK